MGRMTPEMGLSEDRRLAIMELREDGVPLAHVTWEAPELEAVIDALMRLRANMAEPVPTTREPVYRLEVIENPQWDVPAVHSGALDRTVLALRHPGKGWLGFSLPRADAQKLGRALAGEAPAA